MGQFTKKWEDLEFSDNYIFCKVMHDKNLCIQMLEILLGIKIKKINYLETEHSIENFYDSRGIRMDVFLQDSDRIFDIEMQTGDYDDIILRSRYYQSAADINTTPRRTQFKDLKETFIIFICKEDPFGLGLPIYTKKSLFKETNEISYNDKTNNVFYNSSAYDKAEDKEVRNVLQFIYQLQAHSTFTKQLESSVQVAKQKSIWKDEYMYFQDILEDEKEEARKTGLAEGRAEGHKQGLTEGRAEGRAEGDKDAKLEVAKKMISDKLPLETIIKYTGLSKDELVGLTA